MKLQWFFAVLLIFGSVSCVPNPKENKMDQDARFVWSDSTGTGRQVYLVFRKDMDLKPNSSGNISIWAHSRYKLFVNGKFVNFGPVRSYPDAPEFDTYDLTPLLIPGKNFICVQVLQNGVVNYQVPEGPGCFISWGEIRSGIRKVNLGTPGNWKVMRLNGFDSTSPKMTFATGVLESFDDRIDGSWNSAENDGCIWESPVLLKQQDFYRNFIPRTIPFLTQEEIPVSKIPGIYEIDRSESTYSFRIMADDRNRKAWNSTKRAFAETYIYSPENQQVETSLWWGEYYLNGKGPLKNYTEDIRNINQRIYNLDLKKGWNHFFVSYGIVWASWEFYMSVPANAGLEFSPDRKLNDNFAFRTAGPFSEEFESRAISLDLPFKDPDVVESLGAEWIYRSKTETAGNPAIEVAWSRFSNPWPSQDLSFPVRLEPGKDYALVLDMGAKTLGRFFVEFEGNAGTIIDLGFAEDTLGNRPWVLKRAGLYTALRWITSGKNKRLESFKPYGARYLQINIKNADGPFVIRKAGMVSQVYPYEKTGNFECSDTMLNAIWQLGWRTLRVCSEDSYTDTPFRERGLYAGDALPEYAIALAVSGDSRLIKRSIRVFAGMYKDLMVPGAARDSASVNHMSDFPLITLLSWAWTVRYSHDLDFGREFYDEYRNMITACTSFSNEFGLYAHGRPFIEWTEINKRADLTSMQSLIIYSLREMSWMASVLGYEEDAKKFSIEAAASVQKMNAVYWDSEKQAYRDGFFNGKAIQHHYPVSSAWPLIFGQADTSMLDGIARLFNESLPDIGNTDRQRLATPYGSFYIIEALYRLGMEKLAEEYMLKYWSPMILKHNDTAWENFGDGSDGKGQGTLSHAWSGHPTYHMSSKILGVDYLFPLTENQDSMVLSPRAYGISWARGDVPYRDGIIHIDWKIQSDTLYFDYSDSQQRVFKVNPQGKLKEKILILNSGKTL